jgi:uncharacterized protein (TIGR03118 family)
MKTTKSIRSLFAAWQLGAVMILTGTAAFAAHFDYTTVNLDSDIPGVAHETDALLINPWGVVTGVEGNLRASDDATGVSTFYSPSGDLIDFSGTGATGNHSIAIPHVTGTIGAPTGVVDNQIALIASVDPADFVIKSGTATGSSRFLYVTEDGVIAGYNPTVSATAAITGTAISGAGYTGIALSWSGTGTKIGGSLVHEAFVADFAQGKVSVFNNSFEPVTLQGGSFVDSQLPTAPAGDAWSPFNIHTLDFVGRLEATDKVEPRRLLVVTYALHNTVTNVLDDIPTTGTSNNGYVAIYKTDGTFLKQLNFETGQLSSPWGIAISHAPLPGFDAPLVVLIGSHGTGTISAYGIDKLFPGLDKPFANFVEKDSNSTDVPLVIDGLWGLRFASVKQSIAAYIASGGEDLTEDTSHFYFSAGLLEETHGLVGKIVKPQENGLRIKKKARTGIGAGLFLLGSRAKFAK